MKIKLKEVRSYSRQVLDAVQEELGRMDIGIQQRGDELTLIEMDGSPLVLTASQKNKIKGLPKIKEKAE